MTETSPALAGEAGRRERSVGLRAVLAKHGSRRAAHLLTDERTSNQAVRDSGDVGIWHETYRVHAHDDETIYGNMPVFGLAAASRRIPVAHKAHTAAARIGISPTDEPAVAPY